MIAELDHLIAELEAEAARLTQRLHLARQLRATYSEIAPAEDELFHCDECDRSFKNEHGRAVHKARTHTVEISRPVDLQAARERAAAAI